MSRVLPAIHPHGYWGRDNAHHAHMSDEGIADWLPSFLDRSQRTHDLGCGLGTYLRALHRAGFESLTGYEGDPPAVRDWAAIVRHDLTVPLDVPRGNVICLEVAEHVPAEHEAQLLDNIDRACSGRLALSWAVRGQGGDGHTNCRDNGEVLELFRARGFYLDIEATSRARAAAKLPWFPNTVLALRRDAVAT